MKENIVTLGELLVSLPNERDSMEDAQTVCRVYTLLRTYVCVLTIASFRGYTISLSAY